MSEIELKPCPFCGSPAQRLVMAGEDYDEVMCSNDPACAVGAEGDDYEDAVRIWNTRTGPKLKPLVWGDTSSLGIESYRAVTPLGSFTLTRISFGGKWTSFATHAPWGRHKVKTPTLDKAKELAQAEYERRVWSMFEGVPAND